MRKDTTINVDKETLSTLQRISELSRISIAKILRDFATELQSFVDERNPDRLSLMISRYVGKDGKKTNLVICYLAAMYTGSFKFSESLNQTAKDFVEHELVENDIQKKQRAKK